MIRWYIIKILITVFWITLAASYYILAKSCQKWYEKAKKAEKGGAVLVKGSSIMGGDIIREDVINILGFLKESSKINWMGFLLASFAAILTFVSLFIDLILP